MNKIAICLFAGLIGYTLPELLPAAEDEHEDGVV